MMQLKFEDLLSNESNIYQKFIKEKERNAILQQELSKHDSSGAPSGALSQLPNQLQTIQKDTLEQAESPDISEYSKKLASQNA